MKVKIDAKPQDSWFIRLAIPADTAAMLAVAKMLPEWFTAKGLEEMARDFQNHGAIVAVVQGEGREQVVGFVTWAPSPHTPEPGLVEMTWLGVSPRWHGRGIGRCLVLALEDVCRNARASVIQVSTLADSVDYAPYARTRAFYRRLGFKDWRVDPGYYVDGGDRLLLRKTLTDNMA